MMMTKNLLPYIFYLSLILNFGLYNSNAQNQNWTHFRGNNLDAISNETNVPTSWNDSTNVLWKTPIHGKAWSSPVIYDNQVWMTTADEDGKAMYGICLDKASGKIIFDKKLIEPDSVYSKHAVNTYATPTPCIEDGFVYLHFGSYGTFCLSTKDAGIVWKRSDFKCNHVQGPGSSPIIYKDLLILHFEGIDVQYIVALDKKNGELVWKTERPKECYDPLEPIGKKAYITPLVIKVNGKDILISNGAAVCIAYDPETGKEIWRIVYGEDSTIAMPVLDNGILYFYTSFVSAPGGERYAELFAVNPNGKGNIKETNIIWQSKTPMAQLLTPVIKNGLIYTIDTRSNMICYDAKTGAIIWTEKLKGQFNSSPIYNNGNIYFSSTKGEILVIKEGRKFDKLAENKLDGEIWATPAIANKSIFVRTSKFLYRISNK
jgi:outer membrane protein assembly factor BamB